MLKADVCVGCFSGVVPVAPSPLAISALLGLAGVPLSLRICCFLSPQNLENNISAPWFLAFHGMGWVHKSVTAVLLGGGPSRSERAQLRVRWTDWPACLKSKLCQSLCMHALCCVCSWWCITASFQGALVEEFVRTGGWLCSVCRLKIWFTVL